MNEMKEKAFSVVCLRFSTIDKIFYSFQIQTLHVSSNLKNQTHSLFGIIYKRATSSRQRHKMRENLMPFHGGVNLSLGVNVYLNSALVNRSRRPLIMALS